MATVGRYLRAELADIGNVEAGLIWELLSGYVQDAAEMDDADRQKHCPHYDAAAELLARLDAAAARFARFAEGK